MEKDANPRFHALVSERRGEPMIESPQDAVAMFYGCGLEHLILEDVHVCKDTGARLPEGALA